MRIESYSLVNCHYEFYGIDGVLTDRFYLPDTFLFKPAMGYVHGVVISEDNNLHRRNISTQELINLGFTSYTQFINQFTTDKLGCVGGSGSLGPFTEDFVQFGDADGTLAENTLLRFINDNRLLIGGIVGETTGKGILEVSFTENIANNRKAIYLTGSDIQMIDANTSLTSAAVVELFIENWDGVDTRLDTQDGRTLGGLALTIRKNNVLFRNAIIYSGKVNTGTPNSDVDFEINIRNDAGTTNTILKGNSETLKLTAPGYTDGSIPFFGAGGLIDEDNANFEYDNINKKLQIGGEGADTFAVTGLRIGDGGVGNACTTIATWGAQFKGSNSSPGFYFFDHHTQANSIGANIFFYRTRGDASSPTNALNGDNLGSIFFASYRGGAYGNGALIRVAKTEDDTTGQGCELKFHVNKNGQTSSTPTLAIRISEGNLQIVEYGQGNKDATTLSKIQSNYLTGYATDGTLLEVEFGGEFADDTAASGGGVGLGEIYYNTTSGKLKARLT